jgi:leader peptidase (prepilin peptidase) / N-methyltransferase
VTGAAAVLAVVVAGGFGAVVGWAGRRWVGTLRRGAVLRAGAVEAPAALLSAAGVLLTDPWLWPLVVWISVLGAVLGAVDIRHHRLPDAVTLPAVAVTLLVAGGTEFAWPASGSVLRAVAAGAAVGAAFLALALIARSAMGLGDVKLVLSLGAALGYLSWSAAVLGVLAGFVVGGVAAVVGVSAGRWGMRSAIPFGPALLAGCWLTLVVAGIAARTG